MVQGTTSKATTNAVTSRDCKRILVLSSTFPSAETPVHGVFVKERVRFVSQSGTCDIRVVSPVPYFPPVKWFSRWYAYSQIPRHESIDGMQVVRPRYLLPPKVGGYFHPQLMYPFVRRAIDRVQEKFDFEMIDAHFIYPDGVLGALLADHYKCPLVITCRGEDILTIPDLPFCGRPVRRALQRADRLVALSAEIAEAMERLGADSKKIAVIPNGIDRERFHFQPQQSARQRLGLPLERPIALSVGYRLERKGFHLLIDAVPEIRQQFPDVLLVIVGGVARWGQDYTSEIEERIQALNLADHVRLVGARPQDELPHWYAAADVFALLSSREGSPNVLMEALACGLPAVATSVGGIPEVLEDSRLGHLLRERSAKAAAEGIVDVLGQELDRRRISEIMQSRGWEQTAGSVEEVFDKAMG